MQVSPVIEALRDILDVVLALLGAGASASAGLWTCSRPLGGEPGVLVRALASEPGGGGLSRTTSCCCFDLLHPMSRLSGAREAGAGRDAQRSAKQAAPHKFEKFTPVRSKIGG